MNAGTQTLNAASPWIERLARIGFVAKGVVHILIGFLAARAAIGTGGSTSGASGALQSIIGEPFGKVLLGVIAVGLFGYAMWRLIEAVLDTSRRGSESRGLAVRIGSAGKALIYGGLSIETFRLALGSRGDSSDSTEHWTALALRQPFGQALVVLAGAGVAAYGIYQLTRAWRSKLNRDLELSRVPFESRKWITGISRFGIAARGVVFGLIGYLLIAAGINQRASQAEDVGGALRALGTDPFGPIALATVGVGLIAYGLYEFLNARYRKITI
ncbi:MAG TPA: DUF1206 domain-containing protein [Thermoanaerobaculia bacterium]|nr:DUF1206 domain-containing protein [Thermoanaerobaculia bacterium]